MSGRLGLVVTCEHGGNTVPASYRRLFRGRARLLKSHRGHDLGALDMARHLARRLSCPLAAWKVTRLLVEPNRSPGHPSLFSEITRRLDRDERDELLDRYYYPHRRRVEALVESCFGRSRRVVHVASHSFTPVLDGKLRSADVAWLYDPKREAERRFCACWKNAVAERRPELELRRNYPYRGTDDGFTTHLRRKFPVSRYLGIELEVNQKWFNGAPAEWRRLKRDVAAALGTAVGRFRC